MAKTHSKTKKAHEIVVKKRGQILLDINNFLSYFQHQTMPLKLSRIKKTIHFIVFMKNMKHFKLNILTKNGFFC